MDKERKYPKNVSPKMGWDGEQVRFVEPLSEKGTKDTITRNKQDEPEVDRRLSTAQARLSMWINRYNEVMNTAKTMACGDRKYIWTLGPTEHCKSCLALAGKVKRGSYWRQTIMPQDSRLACGGFRCQCSLQPTDKPLSRGPLPRI